MSHIHMSVATLISTNVLNIDPHNKIYNTYFVNKHVNCASYWSSEIYAYYVHYMWHTKSGLQWLLQSRQIRFEINVISCWILIYDNHTLLNGFLFHIEISFSKQIGEYILITTDISQCFISLVKYLAFLQNLIKCMQHKVVI